MQLANPKHELFVPNYAVFASGARAARTAGYSSKTAKFQALRLLKRPEIQARLAERRAEIARDYALDAATLLCKLEAVFIRAYDQDAHIAAARVIETQARIAGILKGRTPSMPPLLALFGGVEIDSAAERLVSLAAAAQTVTKGDKS